MKIKSLVSAWLAGTAFVVPVSQASAQVLQPVSDTITVPAPPVAEEDQDGAADIVVTARRRAERAQDVPIALSVVDARTLEATGNSTLTQVQQLVPSLVLTGGNARNTNVNIRGLGSNAITNDGLENGVGFYIDDVYYGRIGQSQFDLVDLDRIEVLRGPQGTLFGKNTTAGAINITTKLPSFDPEFQGEATLGDYGYHQVRGSFSAPLIGDSVAFRLSLADTHRDGFVTNIFNGRKAQDYDNFTVRGQLLIKPTAALTVRLSGDYSKQTSYSVLNSLVGFFGTYDNGAVITNNFVDRVTRAGYTPLPFDPFARRGDVDADIYANMEGYGVSAKADLDLGGATLTSITAARWWDWYPSNDQDNTSFPVNTRGGTVNHQRQFSQELRIASNGTRTVDYVAGLYYFYQIIRGYGSYAFGPAAANWNLPNANQTVANTALNGFQSDSLLIPRTFSYAAFGQATWNIADTLKLTGGLRFTHEVKRGLFDQFTAAGQSLSGLTPAQQVTAQGYRDQYYPVVAYTARTADDSLSGMLNLSYKVAPDALLYATYARGSKSGGLSLGVLPAGVSAVVRPEKVNAYELGLKSQWFDRRVTFNAALYWTDVTDYQTAIVESIANSNAFRRYLANIPRVRSRGVDADLTFAPSKWVSVSASAAYSDATYRDYRNAPQAPENLNLSQIQDLTGKRLAGAPEFSYTLSGDVAAPIGDWGGREVALYGRADYAHRSSFYSAATNSRYSLIDAYGILNARIGVRTDDAKWDLSFWVKNLTDSNYFVSLGVANNGLVTGLLGEPRTLGVTLRTKL